MTPIIREATFNDATAILRLLIDLAVTSPYTGATVLDVEHLNGRLEHLLAHHDAGFLLADAAGEVQGLLVLMLCDDLFAPDRLAAEVCWYVRPSYRDGLGLRLLEAGEAWARARGARKIQMLGPDPKCEAAFLRRGYVATTRVYERRL